MQIFERDLTRSELDRVQAGFIEHQRDHGNVPGPRTRHGFVLMNDEAFAGCATGLRDNKWYYLSDLWIEEPYRHRGFGTRLLRLWEEWVDSEDVHDVYTWTAGFQAPAFYERHGYAVFAELRHFYLNGHSRFGLRKSFS